MFLYSLFSAWALTQMSHNPYCPTLHNSQTSFCTSSTFTSYLHLFHGCWLIICCGLTVCHWTTTRRWSHCLIWPALTHPLEAGDVLLGWSLLPTSLGPSLVCISIDFSLKQEYTGFTTFGFVPLLSEMKDKNIIYLILLYVDHTGSHTVTVASQHQPTGRYNYLLLREGLSEFNQSAL